MTNNAKMRLQWASPEEPTKGPREWDALGSDGSEYRIKGPQMGSSDPTTRTVAEYYTVLRGTTTGAARSMVGVASARIGEAVTLKEAKAMAQRYHDGEAS